MVSARSLLVMVGLATPTMGCSFEAPSDVGGAGTRNSCERDSDCGEGACRSGGCVALSATLDALLIEVSMPALGAGDASGARYRTTRFLSDVTSEEGLQLSLDNVALISGLVKPSEVADCVYQFEPSGGGITKAGDDGSIPVVATLIPRERLLGVAPLSYSAESLPRNTSDGLTHRFEVRVAPGTYDVYLVPENPATEGCPVAPQLLLSQSIGAGAVELTLPLPPARVLELAVVVPTGSGDGSSLRGWLVDMIDPPTGQAISTTATLEEASDDGTTVTYDAVPVLHYSPVWSIEDNTYKGEGNELVRFRPPEGELGPTMYLARASLELFTEGEALVDQLADVSATVSIEGEVESLARQTPVAAQLIFIATRINALKSGVLASYVVNIASDGEGRFSVDLLPGSYRVQAVPVTEGCCGGADAECACPSAVEVVWEVSDTPAVQAGRTIQLPDSAILSGRVVSPGGSTGLAGAAVELLPSPVPVSQLEELLRDGAFTPRIASTVTGDSGAFLMAADPGLYRMWVRPGEDSGFSWLATSSVTVVEEGSDIDLGRLKMPLPIAYRGKVTFPGAEGSDDAVDGARAMVRAYAYLDAQLQPISDPSGAESAIPVSEARANDRGEFVLLIPDALAER